MIMPRAIQLISVDLVSFPSVHIDRDMFPLGQKSHFLMRLFGTIETFADELYPGHHFTREIRFYVCFPKRLELFQKWIRTR